MCLQGWEKTLGDSVELQGVLYYDCPEEVLTERILARGKTSGVYKLRVCASIVLIQMLVRSVR